MDKEVFTRQILDAIDGDDMQNGIDKMDSLLASKEGREILCAINDLDEAANRKAGVVPNVELAWREFAEKNIDSEQKLSGRSTSLWRYMMIAGVAAACCLIAWLLWPQSAPSASSSVQVSQSVSVDKGRVIMEAEKNASSSVASDGSHQVITIAAGEQKTITLPDGTEVCLNSKSTLKYPEDFGKKERKVEFCGEGYFKVAHDASKPFVIKTKTLSTKVLGTEFNLRCYNEDDVHVTLVKGAVEVTSHHDKVRMSPDQDVYLENDRLQVQEVNTQDFTSWKDGVLYFDNASLLTILQQLGRVYNVSVVCGNEELLGRHFHYMCNMKDSLDEALKLLNETSDINIKLKDHVIVVE